MTNYGSQLQFPTSGPVFYETDKRSWWWGRWNVDEPFIFVLVAFTVVVSLTLALRGIYRAFCYFSWSINSQDPSDQHPPPFQPYHMSGMRPIGVATIQDYNGGRDYYRVSLNVLPPLSPHRTSTPIENHAFSIPKQTPGAHVSLPSYEEATGLPSYNDVIK